MFQPGVQDGFMSPYNPSSLVRNQMAIKAESSSLAQSNDNLYASSMCPGAASAGSDGTNGVNGNVDDFPSWNFVSQYKLFQ